MSSQPTNNPSGKHHLILVTAATAPVGRSIVEQLVAMGHPALALTQDEYAGKIYHLTGPQSLTHREQVQTIGKALGRPLRYEELDEEQARAAISPYAPADVLFETWRRHIGMPAPVTDTMQRLTGRPPHSVEAWAEDLAAHLD